MSRGLADSRALYAQFKARQPASSPDTPSPAWLTEVLAAPSAQTAVALVNERLADVKRETDVGAEVPRVSARIALTAGTALALFALLGGQRDAAATGWAVGSFAAGLLGAFAAAQMGRISRGRTRAQIETWNRFVKLLLAEARATKTAASDKAEISDHQ